MGDRRNFVGDDTLSSPSLIWLPGSHEEESAKASNVPVAGAVVIAPLISSWRNYGSVGGSFALTADPPISELGGGFNGSNQVAIIDTGASADFSVIFRITYANAANPAWVVAVMQPSSSYGGFGMFRYSGASTSNWVIGASAGTELATSVAYNTTGVYSLIRSGTNLKLRRSGSVVASGTVATVNAGSKLFLGARGSSANAFCSCKLSGLLQFNSALNDSDASLVEAWS